MKRLYLALCLMTATDAGGPREAYLQRRSTEMFTLLAIGEASAIGAGLGFLAVRSPFARAVELQALLWGSLDAVRSVGPLLQAKRDKGKEFPDDSWQVRRAEDVHAHWLAAGLEALALALGLALFRLGPSARWRGSGAGLCLQALLLLCFDLLSVL